MSITGLKSSMPWESSLGQRATPHIPVSLAFAPPLLPFPQLPSCAFGTSWIFSSIVGCNISCYKSLIGNIPEEQFFFYSFLLQYRTNFSNIILLGMQVWRNINWCCSLESGIPIGSTHFLGLDIVWRHGSEESTQVPLVREGY